MFGRRKDSEELVPVESERHVSPFEEVEQWFDDFFRTPFGWFRHPRLASRWISDLEGRSPRVDIFEEGNHLVVKAELPGMKKEDIKVSLVDDLLTISGEKKREERVEKEHFYRLERSSGSFSRSFRLPAEVEPGKVTANFKEGILELKIPRSEEARKKEIEIKVH